MLCKRGRQTCQANGLWTEIGPLYKSCVQKCINPLKMSEHLASLELYKRANGTASECEAAKVKLSCTDLGTWNQQVSSVGYFSSCTVLAPPLPPVTLQETRVYFGGVSLIQGYKISHNTGTVVKLPRYDLKAGGIGWINYEPKNQIFLASDANTDGQYVTSIDLFISLAV